MRPNKSQSQWLTLKGTTKLFHSKRGHSSGAA